MHLERGATYLAKGPLRIQLHAGEVESRGIRFSSDGQPIVVKAWECFDLTVVEDCEAWITGNGGLQRVQSAYPDPWISFLEDLTSRGKSTVVFLGTSDTGKSTLCTLALNAIARTGRPVALVDSDVGQSDVGPPTTVGLGASTSPVPRLSELKLLDAFFAGDTSPAYCLQEVIWGTGEMVREGRSRGGWLLVDTCGLCTGSLGQYLVRQLIEVIEPDLLVALQRGDELRYLGDSQSVIYLPPLQTSGKDVESRRAFRLSQYLSWLRLSSKRTYDLSRIRAEGYLARRRGQHCPGASLLESPNLSPEDLEGLRGAILGLHSGDRYVDLGIMHSVDPKAGTLTVTTNCMEPVDRIIVGNLILSEHGERRISRRMAAGRRGGLLQGP